MVTLTSPHNPQIKELLHLAKKRHRREQGLFIIEGFREVVRAHAAGIEIQQLILCPELYQEEPPFAMKRLFCSLSLFTRLSYRENPDGIMALAKEPSHTLEKLQNPSLLLIADGLEKSGNLGAIARSVDASGCDALLVCNSTIDLYSPQAIRSSVGALFSFPVLTATEEELSLYLKNHRVVVATPEATHRYTEVDLKGPVAFVVGREDKGVSSFWKKRADSLVSLPMLGKVDSLNVAQTATLLLYEAVRQRG